MKKLALLSLFIVLLIAINIIHTASNSTLRASASGADPAHTGSPGDGADCTSCHGGTAGFQSGWITASSIPASGYVPGNTYTITATATYSGKSTFGFQVSPQNSTGSLLGTLINTSGQTLIVGSGKYVTHDFSGTSGSGSKSWSFNWIAPPQGTGPVTFYGAFNVADGDGTSSGDIIYVSNLTVQEALSAPIAADQSRCGTGSLTLTASGAQNYRWYNQPTGGTILHTGSSFTTPVLSLTDTFYVASFNGTNESARTKVKAIIHSVPPVPVVQNEERCGNGTVTLHANSQATIEWFTSASGGSPVFTGANFNTPVLNSTTTYYAAATNGNCSSLREAVTVTIIPIPQAPSIADNGRCGEGTVTFTAPGNYTFEWFDVPSGGNPVHAGASFTTPYLTTSTTYYIEAVDGNCRSLRSSFKAEIFSVLPDPVASDVSRCGAGEVILTAFTPGATDYIWYDGTSGNPVHTGANFTTPVLSSTSTYFVEAEGGNCKSLQTEVKAIIIPLPDEPISQNEERCGEGTVTFNASGGSSFVWFETETTAIPLSFGSNFTTPSLSSSEFYYVANEENSCQSKRVEVEAVILPVPDKSEIIALDNNTLQSSEIGSEYEWKRNNVLLTYNTRKIQIETEGNYTVVVENSDGCKSPESEPFHFLGTGLTKYEITGPLIFPNPASDFINIRFSSSPQNVELQVFDISGKKVIEKKITDNDPEQVIDLNKIEPGIYYLQIKSGGQVNIEKLLIR